MSSVDDRIVNMKFNNSQFGQGVDKTKRDLTGLEKTIQNTGKSKGMTQLAQGADAARVKFSALQVAGVTALGTIVAKATAAGLSLVKKLTIQPIMDGFREYTTNLESIQTIMANTGKSVDVVNKYLGELNEYSDQTIYNFSQMAKNIGTFTAAGVELDTATSAIKGISNLAALSGSNSQQASTAMYQLSQAIAAGKVGLMDWNSVVNAGMGGKVFKNALAQTAVAMGDLSAGAVKVGTDVEIMGQSFRNSISAAAGQESWLSSEVLVATLSQLDGRFSRARMAAEGFTTAKMQDNIIEKERQKLVKQGIVYSDKEFEAMVKKADAAYAAATQIKTGTQLLNVLQESIGSMWAQAFQIILGDFEQSKELWGNVGDVVLGIVDKISGGFLGALRIWEQRGGRMKVIDGLANVFGSLVDIFGAIAKGFDDAFPDSKVSLLNRMSKAFFSFSEALVPSKDTLKDIQTIAEAVFSVLHFGFTIVKGVAKGLSAFFGALFSSTEGARGGILSMVASIAEVIIAVEDWLTSGSKITRFLKGIGEVAGSALSPIIAGIGLVVDAFASLLSGEGLGGAKEALDRAGDVFGNFFGGIVSGLDNITSPFDGLKSDIADLAAKAAGPFQGLLDVLDRVRLKIVDTLGLDQIAPTLNGLTALVGSVKDKFVDFAEGLRLPSVSMEDLGNAADWVVDKFHDMADAVNDAVDSLDISGKVDSAKSAISGLFSGLGGGGAAAGAAAAGAASSGTDAMASTAEGASSAFEKLGDVMSGVWDIFATIAGGIKDAFGGMVNAISNIPFPDDALEWATVLNALISGALIKRLFFSKGVLGELQDTIAKLGDGIQESLGQLTDTLKTMQGAIKSEIIKNIAIAVALLVASLVVLSYIPTEKLAQGLGALGIVMGMATFAMSKLIGTLDDLKLKDIVAKAPALMALGAAMVLMATAVAILSAAVIALSFVPWQQLVVGLGAVGVLVGMMTVALSKLGGNVDGVLAAGAAMVLMATAVDILVVAVVALGMIPFSVLAQGMAAVAVMMGLMTVALLKLGGNADGVLAAGAAMVLMATAMNLLVGVITVLGLLPWDVVAQGLVFVAIGLGIMVGALMLLSGNAAGVMAAGAAMVMIAGALNILMTVILALGAAPWEVVSRGLAAVAIGLVIILGAAALAMFILPGLSALTTIITALGLAMLAAGAGFLMFATGLALIVAVGVAAIGIMTLAIHAFIALLPTIAIQMAAAFVTFIQAIALAAPKLRKAFSTIFREMIGTVRDAIPELGKLLQTMIDTGIGILENSIPRWVEMGFTVIDEFLESANNHVPRIAQNATDLAIFFIEEMGRNTVKFANAGMQVIIDTLNGLADAVDENGPKIREAASNLAREFAEELGAALRDFIGNINPANMLPDVDVSGWAAGIGSQMSNALGNLNPLGRRAAGAGGGNDPYDAEFNARGKGDKDKGPSKAELALQKMEADLVTLGTNVDTAIMNAAKLFAGAMNGAAVELNVSAGKLQRAATYQSTIAEERATVASSAMEGADEAVSAADARLDKAKGIKDKAKRKKAVEKAKKAQIAAEKLRKNARKQVADAERQAAAAELKRIEADYASANARDAVTYKDDLAGLGAAKASQGEDLTTRSNELLASAQAKAAEIRRLEEMAAKGGKNADRYRKEAARLRKEAAAETAQSMALAAQAMEAQAAAVAAYAAARKQAALDVIANMAEIRKQREEEIAQRAWDEKYENASDEEKIAMLQARAADNQAKADAAAVKLAEAFAQADALAARIAAGEAVSEADLAAVELAMQNAQEQAAIASQAADAAEADRDTIEQLEQQIANANSSGGAAGGGSNITPSRTALEDAALAVDRYTASVAQAEEMAMAGSSTTQFVQNNYSPEALSASEIYRQTKNLTSVADVKMGV